MRAERYPWVGAVLGLLIALAGTPSLAATRIFYCDARAQGANDGSSWVNAYKSLQTALAAPRTGAEVRVAQGTYTPDVQAWPTRPSRPGSGPGTTVASGDREASFRITPGAVVKGGYAGCTAADPDERDISRYETILSGDLKGNDVELKDSEWQSLLEYVTHPSLEDNSLTVVTIDDNQDSSTVLDGVTIAGGFADGGILGQPNTGDIPSLLASTDGAGAFIANSDPVFIRCTFCRNVTRSALQGAAGGAGVACAGDTKATFRECSFKENIVFGQSAGAYGAGVLTQASEPNFVDCTFEGNVVAGLDASCGGGALANFYGQPRFTRCYFGDNVALESRGGAVLTAGQGLASFDDCTFEGNLADFGGALCSEDKGSAAFGDCIFLRNEAVDAGQGGAAFLNDGSLTADRCYFVGNVATAQGGAVSGNDVANLYSCLLSGNSAPKGGACFAEQGGSLRLANCTVSANQASLQGGGLFSMGGLGSIRNCIFWGDLPDEIYLMETGAAIDFSNIQGPSPTLGGTGNMSADPLFQDPAGPDGVVGTMDDDYRLALSSPCLDAGDDTDLSTTSMTDLDGEPRISGAHADMGAYEFHGPLQYYVDAAFGDDSNSGGSPQRAFATIQRGINAAQSGYSVLVFPGLYSEAIRFKGKAITVAGTDGAPILEAPGDYAVSFYTAEGQASILKNFVITNSDVGIFLAGSSPTIHNVTVAGNEFGISAYAGASPDIKNCILWGNRAGDLFGCRARYSCVERGSDGPANITDDPLFADAENGDYHLLSSEGRYVLASGLWSFDDRTSPCVDAGSPATDFSGERMPNGACINMGAFGGTREASMSDWPLVGDVNHDRIVDFRDLAIVEGQWLMELPSEELPLDPPIVCDEPPQPDPAQWAPDGLPREVCLGSGRMDYGAQMKAAQATSPCGPVEYYFECADHPQFDSGWQTDRTYTVRVGQMRQALEFRVSTQDQYGNMTEWSFWAPAIPRSSE